MFEEKLTPEFIRRCLKGEQQAFRELVEKVEKPLVNIETAEDIFQETMVRMIRHLPEYRPQASFSTWLFQIARNLCLDHIKHRNKVRFGSLDAPVAGEGGRIIRMEDLIASAAAGPLEQADRSDLARKALAALQELDPDRREVMVLRIYHDMPYEQIAGITGRPVGTLKYIFHEAVAGVAAIIGEGTVAQRKIAND
jgi:RNA polymerase sigma-70 factor (ECF subfamily)